MIPYEPKQNTWFEVRASGPDYDSELQVHSCKREVERIHLF